MALVESKPFLGNGTKTKIEPGENKIHASDNYLD